jgi:erythronate-4-phosphate dehydrogenase
MEGLMQKLFLHTYDIEADSRALKAAPENFERFRDNYPVRREFGAYTLSFDDPSVCPEAERFRKIGFRV